IAKAGNLGGPKADITPAEVQQLVKDAAASGNAARGERIYRRKELQCLSCHGIAGVGGQVGPDLTSIGASAQPDYLVESLYLPTKAVKEGYHAVRANLLDGKSVTGIRVRDTEKDFTLRTADDKLITIAKDDLDGAAKEAPSLMPAALLDSLPRQEVLDLVRFLSELGKIGPYAVSTKRLVRQYELIEGTREHLTFFQRNRITAAAENPPQLKWQPVIAQVNGELALSDLPQMTIWNQTTANSVLRFHLTVNEPGAVRFVLNDAAGLTAYLGTKGIEFQANTTLELPKGQATITLVMNRAKRTTPLSIELQDVPNSAARVQLTPGK
ncbi:MAG: c-type cytochrome, partial [Gemmataceae bacterium]